MFIKKFAFATAFVVMQVIPVNGATIESNSIEGTVYYFEFEIERIAGIPEQQMEEYSCVYTISRQKFIPLLREDVSLGKKYNRSDVRAKVVFKDEEPYFVSREGIVRHGSKFFMLSKQDFVSRLTYVKEGKCWRNEIIK